MSENKNIVIITQARMTSTRLPGKVLKKILGKTILEYHIERLQQVQKASSLVVATTTNDTDKPIIDLAEKLQLPVIQGSETNVLSRFYQAASRHHADIVIRVTSDCPLIDPQIIDQLIEVFLQGNYDYASNVRANDRTYPIGMDTEIFSFPALQEAFTETQHPLDLEHVTPFIWRQKDRYKTHTVDLHPPRGQIRLTLDTADDLKLIEKIVQHFYPDQSDFTLQDILNLLEKNPAWLAINQQVQHKHISHKMFS